MFSEAFLKNKAKPLNIFYHIIFFLRLIQSQPESGAASTNAADEQTKHTILFLVLLLDLQ